MSALLLLSKCFRKTGAILERWAQTSRTHDKNVRQAMTAHDMMTHADEGYYARQYLYWLEKELTSAFPKGDARGLDLGCGQGRLTLPLARYCRDIIGVDFTVCAVEKARGYAQERLVGHARFEAADIVEYLNSCGDGSLDFVVMTEVAFFMPRYKQALKDIYRVLRPGGLAFISFRSRYFDLLHSLRLRAWDSAEDVLRGTEGYLWGSGTWFSWHTAAEVHLLLEGIGYKDISCQGIGACSGVQGDPLSFIIRPGELTALEQDRLLSLEIRLAGSYVDNGRYILAVARKGYTL